jgi:hypothetical protein
MDSQLALHLDATRPALNLGLLCNGDEVAVARALRWGRENARPIAEIAAAVGIRSRRVQEIVQHLLHEHHWPIGTAMAAPFGNYLIDSSRELEETEALLRTRGISNLARAAALRRMSLRRYLAEVQIDLDPKEATG